MALQSFVYTLGFNIASVGRYVRDHSSVCEFVDSGHFEIRS